MGGAASSEGKSRSKKPRWVLAMWAKAEALLGQPYKKKRRQNSLRTNSRRSVTDRVLEAGGLKEAHEFTKPGRRVSATWAKAAMLNDNEALVIKCFIHWQRFHTMEKFNRQEREAINQRIKKKEIENPHQKQEAFTATVDDIFAKSVLRQDARTTGGDRRRSSINRIIGTDEQKQTALINEYLQAKKEEQERALKTKTKGRWRGLNAVSKFMGISHRAAAHERAAFEAGKDDAPLAAAPPRDLRRRDSDGKLAISLASPETRRSKMKSLRGSSLFRSASSLPIRKSKSDSHGESSTETRHSTGGNLDNSDRQSKGLLQSLRGSAMFRSTSSLLASTAPDSHRGDSAMMTPGFSQPKPVAQSKVVAKEDNESAMPLRPSSLPPPSPDAIDAAARKSHQ